MVAIGGGGAVVTTMLLTLLLNGLVGWYALSSGLVFEWRVERIWNTTCHGLEGMSGTGRSFKRGCKGAFIDGDTKTIYPKLREVFGDAQSFSALITPFGGQDVSSYTKFADKFAFAFMVPACSFEAAEDGRIRIRAGQVPVPDAYAHPGALQTLQAADSSTHLLTQAAPMVPDAYTDYQQGYQQQGNVWERALELLRGVPMARDLNGRVCRIPIESNHWFIAARTNGGKSSWIWSLVLGLEPAWRLGLVKFWGIDSKMIELSIGRDWWEHYADDDMSSVELLEQCVQDMHARARQMQGVRRMFTPSVETPLNVVVIDEMGYLSAYLSDKKLQTRANTAIAALLAKGRAPGYAVVGAVQDPRKEVCGFRDGFSIRIAGSLPAPMCDLVLGEGMYEAGAYVDRIPLSEPGVAYVIGEKTLKPVLVRAAWCDDTVIQQALLQPMRKAVSIDQLKTDDLGGQLDWNGKPLQQFRQFRYRTE